MSPSARPQDDGGYGGAASSTSRTQRNAEGTTAQPRMAVPRAPRTEQELAQAYKDLARGEQAATALEANLTSLESKLDELLASFEGAAGGLPPAASGDKQDGPGGKSQNEPDSRMGQDSTDK